MSEGTGRGRDLRRVQRHLHPEVERIRAFLAKIGSVRVPHTYRGFRWLAATALVLFFLQVVTGVLLALYYAPDPSSAYASVRDITGNLPAGWAIRNLHHWAAELLLVAVTLHLVVMYFRRAFLRPREYQWVVGVLLLGVMLLFRFTGRMLPWDTDGYFATREGLELLSSVPVVGSLAATWLQGGEHFGATTLSRFFTTHVLLLPWLTVLLAAGNVYLVLRYDTARRGGGKRP